MVTAQRQTQSVQKVPISLTVISGESLTEQGAHDFTDVLSEVPNLSFQYGTAGMLGQGMSSSRGISIRGISGTNTTSVYIDDTPVPVSIDPHLLDIDHVEVLKGPQGTLYGEASMGGTVKIATVRPSSTDFSGNVDVDGHYLDRGGPGTFLSFNTNIPLAKDLLGMRVGGFYLYDPGFLSRTYNDPGALNGNFATGTAGTITHVGSTTSYGGSLSLRFAPDGSGLVIEPRFMAEETRGNGFLAADNSTENSVQRRALNMPEAWTDTFYLAALNVNVDTRIGRLISATSTFYRDSYDQEDASDITQQLLGLTALLPVEGVAHLYNESLTEDLRLETDITSDLHTTAGLYFTDVLGTYDENIQSPGAATGYIPGADAASGGALGTDLGYITHQPVRSTEKAAYFSATYNVTSSLKVSAGIRESYLHSETLNTTDGFYNGGFDHYDLSYSAKAFTPRVTTQYQVTDEHMVYAAAAKGFRPGGVQYLPGVCDGDLAADGFKTAGAYQGTYQSDSLWNYEIGAKTKWFDRRLTANIAAYDMEWHDIQQSIRLPTCGFNLIVNGGAARSRGTELELAYVPFDGLTMSLSGGYQDAKITGVLPISGGLYVGQRLTGVPEVTASASAKYEWSTTSLGRLFFRVDNSYVGNSASLQISPVYGNTRPAYDLLDFRLGTKLANDAAVSLYVKNALNTRPNLGDQISEVANLGQRPTYVVGQPMSIGVEFAEKF